MSNTENSQEAGSSPAKRTIFPPQEGETVLTAQIPHKVGGRLTSRRAQWSAVPRRHGCDATT